MNANIIKKCLEELSKKDFRKDYVIGLLESYYDMLAPNLAYTGPTASSVVETIKEPFAAGSKKSKTAEKYDEEEIPDFLKAGPVGNITQS